MSECPECGEPAVEESHLLHALHGNTRACKNLHRWPCDCAVRRSDEELVKRIDEAQEPPLKKRGKWYRHGGRKGSPSRRRLKR